MNSLRHLVQNLFTIFVFFSNVLRQWVCLGSKLAGDGISTFDFIVCKLEVESGMWLWTSLIVSVAIGRVLTIPLTSIINMCPVSLSKLLLCVLRNASSPLHLKSYLYQNVLFSDNTLGYNNHFRDMKTLFHQYWMLTTSLT